MGEPQLAQRAGNDPVSTKILYEVAEQANTNPIDLSPKLSTVIDTDAVEALFSGSSDGFSRIEFTYAGHRITVQGDETIRVWVE